MDDNTNRCESAGSTSTHSSVIRMNNQELMNALHILNDAVSMINKAFVSLIAEPVQTIENNIEIGVLLNKKELRKEKDLLKKTVSLLSDGVRKMRNVLMNQRKACDKFFECEEYKRVCDVDYISPLSTVDKTESEDQNGGTLLNSLPRESEVGVLRVLDGLNDDFECNYRPCSAPCFRFNSTIIENRTALEDSPSALSRILSNYNTENNIKVEEKKEKKENIKPSIPKETVSDTLVNSLKDKIAEEMTCKLSEWNSDKLVSVISDKLVESISDTIVHSVSEKVAAVVSDKLLQPINNMSSSYRNSCKSVSECRDIDVQMRAEKARYFVLRTRDKENVLMSKCNGWSWTKECNRVLNAACNAQKGVGPIYLFVSVVKSKKFFGCAEVSSPTDLELVKSTGKQNTDGSKDCFQLRWVVLKDIPNDNLRHLIIQKKSKIFPVTKSINTQEMSRETGKRMMEICHCY